jgi:3-mercaptopyruvate sulfurtransferase SseA
MSQRKKWVNTTAGTILFVTALACSFGLPQQGQDFPTPPAFPTENPYFEVPRVTLEEAKSAFDSNSAVFVDTRSEASYVDSHIPGALSIPLDEIESHINELDPDQWIITYCT